MNPLDFLFARFATPRPSRSDLLQNHEAGVAKARQIIEHDPFLGRTRNDRVPHLLLSKVPLGSLKRITLAQLRLEYVHRGQVLVCRTIVKPYKINALMVVVEDPIVGDEDFEETPSSSRSVTTDRVALCNFLSHAGIRTDASDWLPVGTRLFIKEPYYKISRDGMPLVRCESPADIVIVPNDQVDVPLLSGLQWADTLPISYGLGGKRCSGSRIESVSDLQERGNEHFGRKDYVAALEYYTNALELEPDNAVLLSNRSQTYLNLRQYQAALDDASAAQDLNRDNAKAGVRHAKALFGLRRYAEAFTLLEELIRGDTRNAEMLELLKHMQACAGGMHERADEQMGLYNMMSLFRKAQLSRPPYLDHDEYVGPVMVVEIPGKGRGVVATKDVEEGTLLMCAKAYAVVFDDELPKKEMDGFVAVTMQKQLSTLSQSQLVARVVQKLKQEPRTAADLYELYAGTAMTPAFIPRGSKALTAEIGRERIIHIVRMNGFTPDVDRLPTNTPGNPGNPASPFIPRAPNDANDGSGLWLLPSYLNHSCVANGLQTLVGDLLFVRATRRIAKDEEVCVPYLSNLDQFHRRRQQLKDRGFECRCPLCDFERGQPQASRDRRIQLLHEFDKLTGAIEEGKVDVLPRLKILVTDLRRTYPQASMGKAARSRKAEAKKAVFPQQQLRLALVRPLSALYHLLSVDGQHEEAVKVGIELFETEPRCGETAHKRVDTAMAIARSYHALKKADERDRWMEVAKNEYIIFYGGKDGRKVWEEMYKEDIAQLTSK